jgi:hypothetical protein
MDLVISYHSINFKLFFHCKIVDNQNWDIVVSFKSFHFKKLELAWSLYSNTIS